MRGGFLSIRAIDLGEAGPIDSRLIAEVARAQLPQGTRVSAALVQHGKVVAAHSDVRGLLMPIYSLTKTFIAALIFRAVEQGRLTLDESLATHAPDVPDAGSIQILQLLNHTAGLPDYGALDSYHRAIAMGAKPWSDEQFAEQTYRRGLDYQPGTAWGYSNPGYALLVRILEHVYGETLNDILHNEIAKPLGLTKTRVVETLADPAILPASSSSLTTDGRRVDVGSHYPCGWVWHRLIASTAVEVSQFLCAVFDGALLSPESVIIMTQRVDAPVDHPLWHSPGYACGLMSESAGPRGTTYGHNGDGPGYCSSGFYFVERQLAITVLANCEGSDAALRTAYALHDHA